MIPHAKGQFWGKVMPDDTAVSCAKMAEPVKIAFGLWTRVGPRKHMVDGGLDLPCEGAILGKRTRRGVPDDTL